MRCDGSLEEAGGGRNNWWLIVVSLQVGRNLTSIPRYIKGKYYCKGVDYHSLLYGRFHYGLFHWQNKPIFLAKVGQMTYFFECTTDMIVEIVLVLDTYYD